MLLGEMVGPDGLELRSGQSRHILVDVEGVADRTAAISRGSIQLAEMTGRFRDGDPDGSEESLQTLRGRDFRGASGQNRILQAKMAVQMVGRHGRQAVGRGVGARKRKDEPPLALALNAASLERHIFERQGHAENTERAEKRIKREGGWVSTVLGKG